MAADALKDGQGLGDPTTGITGEQQQSQTISDRVAEHTGSITAIETRANDPATVANAAREGVNLAKAADGSETQQQ